MTWDAHSLQLCGYVLEFPHVLLKVSVDTIESGEPADIFINEKVHFATECGWLFHLLYT